MTCPIPAGAFQKKSKMVSQNMPRNQIQGLHNIKGILLDVDGTLYHQAPLRAIMIFLLMLLNFFKPYELIRKFKVILQYRKSQEVLRKSTEMQTGNQNNQILLTARHTGETVAYVSDVIEDWFEKKPLPFIRLFRKREIDKVIGLMQEKGFKLGVFSDYPAKKKLDALGISKFITTIVSCNDQEVYGFKPKTNGFDVAAKKMGLEPSDVVYVGDRPEVDGPGASEAGMKVAIITSFFQKATTNIYPCFNSLHDLLMNLR